jgi:hypothetical protein
MQESQPPANNIIFPVSALYIQLDTNTGKGPDNKGPDNKGTNGENGQNNRNIQLFKRSMIKMPKMDVQPILKSEYPFFTKNVRYPSSIEREIWKTKYEFFFNRELFVDRLRREIDKNPDIYRESLKSKDETESKELYKWMQDTEKHNIMITLRALFPIPEVFGKALKNSFEHILNPGSNSRVLWDVNVRSAANIFGFMYKFGIASKEKEQYFINIGGKRYEVDDVVWENDLINHPVYRKFLGSQRETYEEVARSATDVQEKFDGFLAKLDDELKNMKKSENVQKDFYKFVSDCNKKDSCDDETKIFDYLIKNIKTAKDSDIDELTEDKGGFNIGTILVVNRRYIKRYYDKYHAIKQNEVEDIQWQLIKNVITNYKIIEDYYKIVETTLNDKFNIYDKNKTQINNAWDALLAAVHNLKNIDLEFDDNTNEKFLNRLKKKKFYADLKSDTIFMLRMHIKSKNSKKKESSGPVYGSNSFADRKTLVESVNSKLKTLQGETGENAANLILSIKEDFDNHKQLHSNEGINVFMERDYEFLFERLLKNAIEIKATSIVLRFAKQNIPMNLTGKKPDGTDISPANQRINKYITEFFGTEASINNKLSANVNAVFEPVRKTSNIELYKVLKLFKFGDEITKREFKLSNEDIEKYREVLDKVYSKYISLRDIYSSSGQNAIDGYLYTGVDEVKSTSSTPGKESKDEPEIRRNVQEIYVRMDLVDADKFEKTSRSSCKLFDKELEQEFLYLADPRNKNNTSLSRFRNLDFDSVVPNPMNANNPIGEKEGKKTGGYYGRKHNLSRRIRISTNGHNTRKER